MGQSLSRSLSSSLIHWLRLFSYFPLLLLLLYRYPKPTISLFLFWYHWLSKQKFWIHAVKRFVDYAGSTGIYKTHECPRFVLVKTVELNPSKPCMFIGSPHGLLSEGIIYPFFLDSEALNREYKGFVPMAAGGELMGKLPLYREIFESTDPVNSKVCDASRKTLLRVLSEGKSIGIMPGGFSEAVFTNPHNKVEYSYIKGRLGFIKLAIECKVDIVPTYLFGLNSLYWTPKSARGIRSRLAQKLLFPMIPWFSGKWGTAIPAGNRTVYTVVGNRIDISQYKNTPEDIERAHWDYANALQKLYEENKHKYGEERDLVFIGKDYEDNDCIGQFLSNSLGFMRPKPIKNTISHEEQKRIYKHKYEVYREASVQAMKQLLSPIRYDFQNSPNNIIAYSDQNTHNNDTNNSSTTNTNNNSNNNTATIIKSRL